MKAIFWVSAGHDVEPEWDNRQEKDDEPLR